MVGVELRDIFTLGPRALGDLLRMKKSRFFHLTHHWHVVTHVTHAIDAFEKGKLGAHLTMLHTGQK